MIHTISNTLFHLLLFFQLDENQPLEYLSEHRDVTILFINLVLESAHDHAACLQKVTEVIGAAVLQFQGKAQIGKKQTKNKQTNKKEIHYKSAQHILVVGKHSD